MPGALTALTLATVAGAFLVLRDRLGPARALGVALAAVVLAISAVGLALLDFDILHPGPLRLGLIAACTLVLAGAYILRRSASDPRLSAPHVPSAPAPAPHVSDPRLSLRWVLAVTLVLAVGTALRLAPSPYLHGGQDQGIYVNVGHHIARTGRLRPVDTLMRGDLPGVRQDDVIAAYKLRPLAPDSPLVGVREGRWIAGIHIESARDGRLVPGFFALLPVWFALAELDWGFARSTWPLVLFWSLSGLAVFALARRLTLMSSGTCSQDSPHARDARACQVGLIALAALALHPLDLWISTFPVTENLARAGLLAAAWFALEAACAERDGRRGAALLAALGGLCFAAGAFTRGSMIAFAIVLVGALTLAPPAAPRSRRAFALALVLGTTLAVVQAVVHSWPYFFSAASNHFYMPRLTPRPTTAALWALAAGALLLAGLAAGQRLHTRPTFSARARRLLRLGVALVLALAAGLLLYDLLFPAGLRAQTVLAVLTRHGGPLPLLLAGLGFALAVRRAGDRTLPWLAVAAAILLATAWRSQIRYEFYYARYLVGDAVPVLVVAAAWLWGQLADRLRGPRRRAVLAVLLLAWLAPPLRLLAREVYWTRDLAGTPAQLADMFATVPDDAVLFFDDRAPLRWRGILGTPAMLSFGRRVLAVRPSSAMVEFALKAGTPVYMLSGGWEPDDRQRWPSAEHGPWRTEVVARGTYVAPRAEIIEGGAPERLTDWGGPWEMQRFDRSIWRDSGAFSLFPDSAYLRSAPAAIETEPLDISAPTVTRVELWLRKPQPRCTITAALRTDTAELALEALPRERNEVLLWALPPPAGRPAPARLVITASCPGGAALPWRWLSVRAPN